MGGRARAAEAQLEGACSDPPDRVMGLPADTETALHSASTRPDQAQDGTDSTSSVGDRATHGWIQLGVKGTFSL